MPRFRPCACGCGLCVSLIYDRAGRFKCYKRYHSGHGYHSPERLAANAAALKKATAANEKPIGTTRIHQGYVVVKVGSNRWRYEHRLVMEHMIGRPLTAKEHAHHRNGDKTDNRRENLELLNVSEHTKHHHRMTPGRRLGSPLP